VLTSRAPTWISLWKHFNLYEEEAQALLIQGNALFAKEGATGGGEHRFPLLPTYELALKCSTC